MITSASPLAASLQRLAQVRAGRHPVVTYYVKLEPRDRVRGKYLIKLKNRVRDATRELPRLGLDRGQQDAVARDLGRIHAYLRTPGHLPATHGLAIFAAEGVGLFEVHALPAVHRSRLAIDQTPLVKELASVEDEFGRLLAVTVDRMSARLFEVTAFGARELSGLRADSTRGGRFHSNRDSSSGWGEHTYHNRIRHEKQRHYETIARALFEADRRNPAHGIVLGGTGAEAGAVEPFLHTYLRARLMGTVRLNPKTTTPAMVHEAVLAVRAEHERAEERALAGEVEEKTGTGWAVNGIAPTLKALARGQVRSLLVHADASMPGFRCGDTGRLVLTDRDGRGEGEAVPVLDVVDSAIEEALRQQVDVNVVYEPEAADSIAGLAGLLRFR